MKEEMKFSVNDLINFMNDKLTFSETEKECEVDIFYKIKVNEFLDFLVHQIKEKGETGFFKIGQDEYGAVKQHTTHIKAEGRDLVAAFNADKTGRINAG